MKPLAVIFVLAPFAVIYLASQLHTILWPSEDAGEEGRSETRPHKQNADRMADAHAAAAVSSAPATVPIARPVSAQAPAVELPSVSTEVPAVELPAGPLARERERHALQDLPALEQAYNPEDDFAVPDGFSLADSRHD